MYCENCGAKIDNDSKFCENCGVLVRQDHVAAAFSEETEEMQPVTDINDLMGLDKESDFEEAWPGSEKTMVFVKQDGSLQETQRFEYVPDSRLVPEAEERPEPEAEIPEVPEQEEPEPAGADILRSSEPENSEPEEVKAAEPEAKLQEKDSFLAGQSEEEPESLQQEDQQEDSAESPKSLGLDQEAEEILPIFGEPEGALSQKLSSLFAGRKEQEEAAVEPEPEFLQKEEQAAVTLPPAPETESEEEPELHRQLFCMACGKKLPDGAAFCDACGTPTGEVAPAEIRKRRNSQGVITELIKGFFVKPASIIEKAASEDAFAAGMGFFIVKDVILAVLSAVFMNKLTASLGMLGAWLVGGDPFGFGAKIFLCGIILDALWIGILYGAGRLFRLGGSVKALIGATGTAGLFPAALLIITVILAAFVPAAAVCAAMVTAAAGLVFMTRAVSVSFKSGENVMLYMTAAAAACYVVLIYIAARLIA